MKISDIKKQVKTEGRYSIYIDGKFSFGLSELGLINSGLRIGTELTTEQLDELKADAHIDKIYNMALGLIARRPRSRWEIEEYLKRKGLERDEISQVCERLSRYIDDLEFARAWVSNRRLLKNMSSRKLRLELRAKRVDDETVSQVLAEDETDELDVLRAEVLKRRKQTRYQDDQKLMAYLARQGYGYDDIKSVLSELADNR